MALNIGSMENGDAADLNLDSLVGDHLCIVANSGGGKSGLVRKVLEATHGEIQQIVFDPEDEFYTLRTDFDFIIAGGPDGDCPATVENAAAMATLLLTTGASAVIQLNHLKAYSQELFVAAFLEAVMEAPQKLWHPCMFVMDEAHRWAPQNGGSAAFEAVKELMSRGRKRGFTGVLVSQRVAKIDKNVTDSVNNWALGRVGQATDRDTIAKVLGFKPSSDEARGLQSLAPRMFWVFGQAFGATTARLMRVGDVETAILKAGQAKPPTPPPPEALKKLLGGLRAPPAPGVPDKGSAPVEPLSEAARAAIRAEGFVEGEAKGMAEGLKVGWTGALTHMRLALDMLESQPMDAPKNDVVFQKPAPPVNMIKRAADPPKAGPTPEVRTHPALTGAQQRVVDAISWWEALGVKPVDRRRVALRAGISPNSSTLGVYVSQLTALCVVEIPTPGTLGLTGAGRGMAVVYPKINPKEVRTMAANFLSGQPRRLFEILAEAYPEELHRHVLADELGVSRTSSTLGVYISEVTKYGFVEVSSPGMVRAAAFLFPEKRR